jgi:hypothetical protein
MTRGYTVDYGTGSGFGMDHASRWAPGVPIKSIIKVFMPRNTLPVATFRCESCGYLESFAAPEFASRRQFGLRAMFVVVTIVAVALGILGIIIRILE